MAPKSKDQMFRTTLLFSLALFMVACVEGKDRPADGSVHNVFTLKGTVQVLPNPNLACTASDANKDCKGSLYWALFDKPITNFTENPPFRYGTLEDAKNGATFTAVGVPVKPQLYMGAFLDDNDNMSVAKPLPDKGDPVFYSLAGFSVQAGQTFNYSVTFLLRLW